MRRPRNHRVTWSALVVAATLCVSTAAVSAPADGAASSKVWTTSPAYGVLDHGIDGDTEAITVEGDGGGTPPAHVRNAGIQAMETGQCHAAQAAATMTSLTAGRRLRMSTTSVALASQGRPVRHVDAWNGSTWVDVQQAMLSQGQALPLPGMGDTTRWRAYATAAQQAALRGAGLFDRDLCRPGPSQSTPLRLWVNYDGNGDESTNPNTEYVRVLNSSTTPLPVGGWWIRTAAQDTFVLPKGSVVPAGGLLTLRVGKGTNSATRLYWGNSGPKFSNVDLTRNIYGGGAYLFDPDGDVRAWSMYPCLTGCSDARAGRLSISVRADAEGTDAANVNGEYIRIAPSGVAQVDLSWTVVSTNGFTYEFPRGTVVRAGEVLTLHAGKGSTTRLRQYWGNSGPILVNAGQRVEVRTPTAIRLGCRAWGTGRC